jgi:Domain of unknown function (DUF4258)
MKIDDLIDAIQTDRLRITDHAVEAADDDALSLDDVFSSVFRGEIIERYPTERPYPRYLVYGLTDDNAPVHSVWAYNDQSQSAALITVYRPDPDRWNNWRKRRFDP